MGAIALRKKIVFWAIERINNGADGVVTQIWKIDRLREFTLLDTVTIYKNGVAFITVFKYPRELISFALDALKAFIRTSDNEAIF